MFAQTAEEALDRLQQSLGGSEASSTLPAPPPRRPAPAPEPEPADDDAATLKKVTAAPKKDQLAGGFARGDRVTWIDSDADVPSGSVGTVKGASQKGGEWLQVTFPKGEWRFPASKLRLATAEQTASELKKQKTTGGEAQAPADNHPGIWIQGHEHDEYNGLYKKDAMHEGWPVYKHEKNNRYCYRLETKGATDRWRLGTFHNPNQDRCSAKIESPTGPVPTGAREWRCYNWRDGKWVPHTLTITGMVRCLLLPILSLLALEFSGRKRPRREKRTWRKQPMRTPPTQHSGLRGIRTGSSMGCIGEIRHAEASCTRKTRTRTAGKSSASSARSLVPTATTGS